jgi:hypothetical protein
MIAGINSFGIATVCYEGLGLIAQKQGDFATATVHFEQYLDLALLADRKSAQFIAYAELAEVALLQRNVAHAKEYLAQMRTLTAMVKPYAHKFGLVQTKLAAAQANWTKARDYGIQTLQITAEWQYVPEAVETLLLLAEAWYNTGDSVKAQQAIALALSAPNLEKEWQKKGKILWKMVAGSGNFNKTQSPPPLDFWQAVTNIMP